VIPEIFRTQTKNHRLTAPKKQNRSQFTACGDKKQLIHFAAELANLARVFGAKFFQFLTELSFFVDQRRLVSVDGVVRAFQLGFRICTVHSSARSPSALATRRSSATALTFLTAVANKAIEDSRLRPRPYSSSRK